MYFSPWIGSPPCQAASIAQPGISVNCWVQFVGAARTPTELWCSNMKQHSQTVPDCRHCRQFLTSLRMTEIPAISVSMASVHIGLNYSAAWGCKTQAFAASTSAAPAAIQAGKVAYFVNVYQRCVLPLHLKMNPERTLRLFGTDSQIETYRNHEFDLASPYQATAQV